MLRKGGGAWTVYWLKGCLEKGGWCFGEGWYPNAHSYLLPPLFKGGSEFSLPPPEEKGESEKLKWKYGAGARLLKSGGRLTFFWFNFVKVYHFHNHLEITLPLAIWIWIAQKLLFFATIVLGKNVILSCLKMNLKIFHQLR